MIPFIFLFLTSMAQAQEANIPSVLENRKGIEALKKDNPVQAQQHFLESLSSNPLDARIQLNLGFSLEKMGQQEKARAAYDFSAKFGHDPEVLFTANFNRGVLYQKEKKKDEAIAAYQEALKYNPDSLEAKTNIELLTADGQGQDDKQDQKKDGDQGKDQKDQQQGDNKDQKDPKDQDKDGQDPKKDQPKQYGKNKPQPKPFKSEELTQGDVNKILGEIKQQEQKIRAEFNKKDVKDKDLDKDW